MSREQDFEDFREGQSDEYIQAALDGKLLIGDAAIAAQAYLLSRANEREAAKEIQARADNLRAVAAAEGAARGSNKAALWTMIAAIAAALGALATAVAAFVPFFFKK